MKTVLVLLSMIITLNFSTLGIAADDPSISPTKKEKIKATMVEYIKANETPAGHFLLLDSKEKMTRKLKFDSVHEGVIQHHDGFLACVDMLDGETVVDVDFVVAKEGDAYRVSKIVIHKVGFFKRKGHLDH